MRMGGSRGGGGGGGGRGSVKNHKNIGFPSNTRPYPLKNHKVTKPAFNVWPSSDSETPFKWRFAGGSMLARLWWYLDRLSPHQLRKKTVVKGGPPQAKLSGSAQDA